MTEIEHARERIHQLEDKAYRYGLELADRRLEAADLAAERYQLEQEVEKLRAENAILHEEIRLREVASWKGRGLGGKKK